MPSRTLHLTIVVGLFLLTVAMPGASDDADTSSARSSEGGKASPPVSDDPTAGVSAKPPLTRYLKPLQDHDEQLKAIAARIARLRRAAPPDSDEAAEARKAHIRKVGLELLSEAKALQRTVSRFMDGRTRRGLIKEIELVRGNIKAVNDAVAEFRLLPGVQPRPLDDRAREALRKELIAWARGNLQKRIAARLDSEGLRDIILSKSVDEASAKAYEHAARKVVEEVEEISTKAFGVPVYDERSARRALKQGVNRAIDRKIAALLVRVSSNEIVIEIGKEILCNWVKSEFWDRVVPRVKEIFRNSGNHEPRTEVSLRTLESTRMQLMRLKPDSLVKDVEITIARARRSIVATRHLEGDLTKAKKQDLLKKLNEQIEHVERAISLTRARFLLDKESNVQRLAVDLEVLVDAMAQLRELLKGQSTPDVQLEAVRFLPPYQLPTEDGPIDAPEPPTLDVPMVGISSTMRVVHFDAFARAQKRWRDRDDVRGYMSLDQIVARTGSFADYVRDHYIVKVTHGGTTRYIYAASMQGSFAPHGKAVFQCSKDGIYRAQVVITCEKGWELKTTIRWRVLLEDMERAKRQMELRQKYFDSSRKAYKETTTEMRAKLAQDLVSAARRWVHDMRASGGSEQEVMKVLAEVFEATPHIAEPSRPDEKDKALNRYVQCLKIIADMCEQVPSDSGLALARQASERAAAAAGQISDTNIAKTGAYHASECYRRLASLHIAVGCDIESARAALEKELVWKKKQGRKFDEEEWQKHWPRRWKAAE